MAVWPVAIDLRRMALPQVAVAAEVDSAGDAVVVVEATIAPKFAFDN